MEYADELLRKQAAKDAEQELRGYVPSAGMAAEAKPPSADTEQVGGWPLAEQDGAVAIERGQVWHFCWTISGFELPLSAQKVKLSNYICTAECILAHLLCSLLGGAVCKHPSADTEHIASKSMRMLGLQHASRHPAGVKLPSDNTLQHLTGGLARAELAESAA